MKSLDDYLEIANKVTDLVGEFALKNFGEKKVTFHKAGLEYTIDEDKKANDLYEQFLKKETPEVVLYTEEGEKNLDSDLVWTIDPIDGTTNYSKGNPFWNTQICLLKNHQPVVSIVYAPALNQKFTARKGGGVFLNGKKIGISKVDSLEMATFVTSSGNRREDRVLMGKIIEKLLVAMKSPRIFSSIGLELSFTASSMIDLFWGSGASTWDYAPGVLLIREAGGIVLNFEGKDWTIDDKTLVASNEILAKQVLELL